MIFSTSWQDAEWQSVELREDTGNINIGRTTVAQEGIKIADPAVSKSMQLSFTACADGQ